MKGTKKGGPKHDWSRRHTSQGPGENCPDEGWHPSRRLPVPAKVSYKVNSALPVAPSCLLYEYYDNIARHVCRGLILIWSQPAKNTGGVLPLSTELECPRGIVRYCVLRWILMHGAGSDPSLVEGCMALATTATGKPSRVHCTVYVENYARVHRIDELWTETPMSRTTSTAVARIGTTFYGLLYWVRYQIRVETVADRLPKSFSPPLSVKWLRLFRVKSVWPLHSIGRLRLLVRIDSVWRPRSSQSYPVQYPLLPMPRIIQRMRIRIINVINY